MISDRPLDVELEEVEINGVGVIDWNKDRNCFLMREIEVMDNFKEAIDRDN